MVMCTIYHSLLKSAVQKLHKQYGIYMEGIPGMNAPATQSMTRPPSGINRNSISYPVFLANSPFTTTFSSLDKSSNKTNLFLKMLAK